MTREAEDVEYELNRTILDLRANFRTDIDEANSRIDSLRTELHGHETDLIDLRQRIYCLENPST